MNPSTKKILLPLYYSVLRTGRKLGLIYKPEIKICISSTKKYADKTIPPLIASLLQSGIAGTDVYVFEGGHDAKNYSYHSYHHFLTDHNSIDFTALIEAAESAVEADYWFFLHDTCLVGKKFGKLVANIPHFMPDAMPLKNYPSMNIGAYKYNYLKKNKELLQLYRNNNNDDETLRSFKQKGFLDEDILFKQSKDPVVYNGWLLEPDEEHKREDVNIPDIYAGRICEYFPQADLYKFKANFQPEQRGILEL